MSLDGGGSREDDREMPRLLVGYGGPYREDERRVYFHPPEGADVRYPSGYDTRAYSQCTHCERHFAVTLDSVRIRVLACSARCSARQRGQAVHDDGAPKRKYTRRQVPGAFTPSE